MSTTVRINDATRELARELSEKLKRPMMEIIEDAVVEYRRAVFLKELEQQLMALKDDRKAWDDYQNETALWDATLSDGWRDEPAPKQRTRK